MKMLEQAAFGRAAAVLKTQARPVERAQFVHEFEGGPAGDVLAALAGYQNADGGFHGLEADVRTPDSSVIATTIAFQIFRRVSAPETHPVVEGACRYLETAYNPQQRRWPVVPPSVMDAPHAPWWDVDGAIAQSAANPLAEIVGYLYDYPAHFPDAMRETLMDAAMEIFETQLGDLGMHDLLCYQRLWETAELTRSAKGRLFAGLERRYRDTIATDRATWSDYGLRPLEVITSPESLFLPGYEDAVADNLDYLIETQDADGTWEPAWSWGGRWPEAWEQAAREWRGVLTLKHLRRLQAFGRIAG